MIFYYVKCLGNLKHFVKIFKKGDITEKLVKDFNEKYMKPPSPDIRMLDIQSGIGELAKEVVKSEDYGKADFKLLKI